MKSCILILILICSIPLFSQRQSIEKLQIQLIDAKGTVRNSVLNQLVHEYYRQYNHHYVNVSSEILPSKLIKEIIIETDSLNHKEYDAKMREYKLKYGFEKKEQQLKLQTDLIEDKDRLINVEIIASSLLLIALIIIFVLYRIKKDAYKLLVYQSIENMQIIQSEIPDEELFTDEDTNEPMQNRMLLDEELKNLIQRDFNEQIKLKVFLDPNLNLKTFAEKCNTNRSYLSQYIHEQHHMNFNTYINKLRIEEAKMILTKQNDLIPLKSLYFRLGFNSYSVFNEAFKKHVGVTPAFYLKTIREINMNANA